MKESDKEFEKYLGEFQPRQPRSLPTAVTRLRVPGRLAAAAVIFMATGISLWFVGQKKTARVEFAEKDRAVQPATKSVPAQLSAVILTQMALENPRELAKELDEASRRVLPDFRAKDSTLRVLAKE